MPRARWEALARKRASKGRTVRKFAEKPELFEDLRFSWDAWHELSIARDYRANGTASPIKHSEIVAFLDLNLLRAPELRHDTYREIMVLELTWLAHVREKAEGQDQPPQSKENQNGNPRSRIGGKVLRRVGQA